MAKATEAESVGGNLLSSVRPATDADLEAVDAEIATRERDLDMLHGVRNLLAVALGKEEVKKRGGCPPGGWKKKVDPSSPARAKSADAPMSVGDERRNRILRHMGKEGGFHGAGALCHLFDIPNGSITSTMQHAWFRSGSQGYELTLDGRNAYRELIAKDKP